MAAEPFKVFDGTLFRNKPSDLKQRGFERIAIIYEGNLEWPSGKRDMPSKESVQRLIREIVERGETRVEFDLESEGFWHGAWFAPNDEIKELTARKLLTIVEWTKEVAPDIEIGFYNYTPTQAPYATNDPAQTPSWRNANIKWFQTVADASGRMSPQLYTFLPEDEKFWMTDAEQVIALAREMGRGKPVTPYIWFQTHGGADAKLWYAPVPPEFFKRQLEKIHAEGADGVIIWGGYQQDWDENAAWWQATQEFLATNPQVIRNAPGPATQPSR